MTVCRGARISQALNPWVNVPFTSSSIGWPRTRSLPQHYIFVGQYSSHGPQRLQSSALLASGMWNPLSSMSVPISRTFRGQNSTHMPHPLHNLLSMNILAKTLPLFLHPMSNPACLLSMISYPYLNQLGFLHVPLSMMRPLTFLLRFGSALQVTVVHKPFCKQLIEIAFIKADPRINK